MSFWIVKPTFSLYWIVTTKLKTTIIYTFCLFFFCFPKVLFLHKSWEGHESGEEQHLPSTLEPQSPHVDPRPFRSWVAGHLNMDSSKPWFVVMSQLQIKLFFEWVSSLNMNSFDVCLKLCDCECVCESWCICESVCRYPCVRLWVSLWVLVCVSVSLSFLSLIYLSVFLLFPKILLLHQHRGHGSEEQQFSSTLERQSPHLDPRRFLMVA